MSEPSRKLKVGAFTLIEVLVVLAILAVLAALVLPTLSGGGPSRNTKCLGNLKQVTLAFLMYGQDNKDKFPMQVSVMEGGTRDFIFSNHAFPHFQKISSYLRDLGRFVCPFETNRQPASSYEALNDLNLSFFLNADASPTNNPVHSILAGDRCLRANGNPVRPGLFLLTTNDDMTWTPGYHANRGNFAFADGHAEFLKADGLNLIVRNQPLATNRLAVP